MQLIIKGKRDDHLDNTKFWLVLLVVFGHFIEPGIEVNSVARCVYLFIYLFHIPAFVFLSGYFSKKHTSSESLLKLFFLYLFFQLIYSFFTQLPFDLLNPHWVLWYLLSLLTWRLMLPYILKLKYPFLISLLIGLAIGLLPEIDTFLSLSRTFYFLPFFILGYLVAQKNNLHPLLFKRFRLLRACFFVLILAATVYFSSIFNDINPEWLYGSQAFAFIELSWWQGFLSRLVQYAAALVMMFLFTCVVPFSKNKLTPWGQRSLYVFAWHGLLLLWFRRWVALGSHEPWLGSGWPLLWNGWGLILFFLIASFILTLILSIKWSEKVVLFFWKPFRTWMLGKENF